jgi:long-chain fatty acid transport protein
VKLSGWLAALVTCVAVTPADGGGFDLPSRGVRSLARAGAFVAGADDADALWHDPAGLAHLAGDGKRALLFDTAFVYRTLEHVRLDPSGAPLAGVTNQQPGQLLPTLVGALGIGKRLVIAGGLTFASANVHEYPVDGPQRYASTSTNGSKTVMITIGAAYVVDERLRLGASLSNIYTQTSMRFTAFACPGALACTQEDPALDATVGIEQTDTVSPTASIGVQYDLVAPPTSRRRRGVDDAAPRVTVGLVAQAPWRVSADGQVTLALPRGGPFLDAQVLGDKVTLERTSAPSLRAGLEVRPATGLRLEVGLAVELWSLHKGTTITPSGVAVSGPNLGGPGVARSIDLAAMKIPAGDRTTFAPSLAVEWHGPSVMLGAGVAYETSAFPAGEVSVRAHDAPKVLIGAGGGWEDDGWQIGASFGAVVMSDVDVALDVGQVPLLQPLREPVVASTVNAGAYRGRYLLAGIRFARRW